MLRKRFIADTLVVALLLLHLHLHHQIYNYASVVEETDIEKTLTSLSEEEKRAIMATKTTP